jgi:hypothetical protein
MMGELGSDGGPDESKGNSAYRNANSFARIPWSVLGDEELSSAAIFVYAILAICERGGESDIGQRLIAKYGRMHRRKARECLRKLTERGHIELIESTVRKRLKYRLTSPIFKGLKDIGEVGGGFKGGVKKIPVKCPECRKMCGGLLKVGWCRRCNRNMEIREIAREVFVEEGSGKKSGLTLL